MTATTAADDQAAAKAAEAEATRIQLQIDGLLDMASDPPGDYDAGLAHRQLAAFRRRLAVAHQRARPSALDPLLASLIGPGAGRAWGSLPVESQRRLVAMIARVTLWPLAPGEPKWCTPLTPRRVGWEWKLRSAATGQPVGAAPPPPSAVPAYVPAAQALAGQIAAWLASQDGPRRAQEIAAGLGTTLRCVRHALPLLLDDGQLARQRGTGKYHNAYLYLYTAIARGPEAAGEPAESIAG